MPAGQCLDPPCKQEADGLVKDAIVVDKNGAVLHTKKTKQLASARLGEVKKKLGHRAQLSDSADVRAWYLVVADLVQYHKSA